MRIGYQSINHQSINNGLVGWLAQKCNQTNTGTQSITQIHSHTYIHRDTSCFGIIIQKKLPSSLLLDYIIAGHTRYCKWPIIVMKKSVDYLN